MNQVSTSALAARKPGQPRLSIAIPTYNRAALLAQLLEALLPQILSLPADAVELIVSDNCSTDYTGEMIAGFQARGLSCRYVRNASNLGPDGNILSCWNLSKGEYVWVLGDDDMLIPSTLSELFALLDQVDCDMIYISSFSFTGEYEQGDVEDRLGRYAELITDGEFFIGKVNALIALISVNIVNKNRLLSVPHSPLESLLGTNLVQLGWQFPLIHRRMSVLCIWRKLVGYRTFNSAGWGVVRVFGIHLEQIAQQYFASEPSLGRLLMNNTLRYWMCDVILGMRRGSHAELDQEDFTRDINHLFRSNWRYWIFVYPVAKLPMPLAKLVHRALFVINKLHRAAQTVWWHLFRHGRYLTSVAR